MIKQFISSSVCLKCHGCCRFSSAQSVWLPRPLKEEKKIKLIFNPKQGNFTCNFLKLAENKCKIYKQRPFECQLYPFLINRAGKKIFLAVDLNCPFSVEKLKSKKFKAYVKYLTCLLNQPRWQKTLKANPQIIQAYPKGLNLSVLKI